MTLSIFRGDALTLGRKGPSRFSGVGPIGDQLRGADLHVTASLVTRAAQSPGPSFYGPVARTEQNHKTALITLHF